MIVAFEGRKQLKMIHHHCIYFVLGIYSRAFDPFSEWFLGIRAPRRQLETAEVNGDSDDYRRKIGMDFSIGTYFAFLIVGRASFV